eukprot:95119_1
MTKRKTHRNHRKSCQVNNQNFLFMKKISNIYGSNVFNYVENPKHLNKLFEYKHWLFSHKNIDDILSRLLHNIPSRKRFRFNADCNCNIRDSICLSINVVTLFKICQKWIITLDLYNFRCFKMCLEHAQYLSCKIASLKLAQYIINFNYPLSFEFLLSDTMRNIIHNNKYNWLLSNTYWHFKYIYAWNNWLFQDETKMRTLGLNVESIRNNPIELINKERMNKCTAYHLFHKIQGLLMENNDCCLDIIYFTFDMFLQINSDNVPYKGFQLDYEREYNKNNWKRYLWLDISNAWCGMDSLKKDDKIYQIIEGDIFEGIQRYYVIDWS